MTISLRRFVLLAVVLAAVIHRTATAAPSSPPDLVVIIMIDTLRADHLPIYGYSRNTTPQLSPSVELR